MARIRALTQNVVPGKPHPTEVDAEWSIVHGRGGELLIQLSTFGSDDRVSQPKVSQTIQLDRGAATLLSKIIAETFD